MTEPMPDEAKSPAAADAENSTAASGGSGDGGTLGTPSGLPDERPPSADQEENEAVSGGGVVSDPEDSDRDAGVS